MLKAFIKTEMFNDKMESFKLFISQFAVQIGVFKSLHLLNGLEYFHQISFIG